MYIRLKLRGAKDPMWVRGATYWSVVYDIQNGAAAHALSVIKVTAIYLQMSYKAPLQRPHLEYILLR